MIDVITVLDDVVLLDVDCDGVAETDMELEALGITLEEREFLATLFVAGDSFWRAPTTHFTPFDFN